MPVLALRDHRLNQSLASGAVWNGRAGRGLSRESPRVQSNRDCRRHSFNWCVAGIFVPVTPCHAPSRTRPRGERSLGSVNLLTEGGEPSRTQAQLAMAAIKVHEWKPVGNQQVSNSALNAELKSAEDIAHPCAKSRTRPRGMGGTTCSTHVSEPSRTRPRGAGLHNKLWNLSAPSRTRPRGKSATLHHWTRRYTSRNRREGAMAITQQIVEQPMSRTRPRGGFRQFIDGRLCYTSRTRPRGTPALFRAQSDRYTSRTRPRGTFVRNLTKVSSHALRTRPRGRWLRVGFWGYRHALRTRPRGFGWGSI